MKQADSILKDLLQGMAPAAEFLRASRADFQLSQVEHKGKNDLVSHVDRETEALLVAACREILPEAGFILEEGDAEGSDQPWRWIIDPLDGTTNFVHDFPAWCMSVALQHNEKTMLGVVWDVPRNEVFSAVRGQGAWRNGAPIEVSTPKKLQDAMLGMGFPYAGFDRLSDYMAVAQQFLESSHGLRRSTWLGLPAADSMDSTKLGCKPGMWQRVRSSFRKLAATFPTFAGLTIMYLAEILQQATETFTQKC